MSALRPYVGMSAVAFAFAALSLVAAVSAPAQEAPEGDKPWYKGVSAEDRAAAGELYTAGAALHREGQYEPAAAKYREALALWDHPDIHFNMAQVYIKLGKPVAAYDSVLGALRHGPDALEPRDRAKLLDYKELLERQLARVTIASAEPGASVSIDGEVLFSGPGEEERMLVPGRHRVVARKEDYRDDSREVELQAGERRTLTLAPVSLDKLATVVVVCDESGARVARDGEPLMDCPNRREEIVPAGEDTTYTISRADRVGVEKTVKPEPRQRVEVVLKTSLPVAKAKLRWKQWQPVTVVATGVVMGALGGYLQSRAVANMESYDRDIDSLCGVPVYGCFEEMVPDDVLAQKSRAISQNRFGIGFMVAGGVGIVAGLTWIYFNRPQNRGGAKKARTGDNEARAVQSGRRSRPMVTPLVSHDAMGIATEVRF